MQNYQKKALEVKLYHEQVISPPFSKLNYLHMGLVGEVGELGEKLKKIIRDQDCQFKDNDLYLLKAECADILWYLTAIIDELDGTLEETMQISLNKIEGRIERDTLKGSGDIR